MFDWRQRGTPFNQPCCGSVFKNPGGPSWKKEGGPRTAGQLIEAAGLKGFRVGGAEVSPMHANYFVNTGGATAADVRGLIVQVQRRVEQEFGARLEPEVKLIGSRGEYLTPCHPEHSEGGRAGSCPLHFVQGDSSTTPWPTTSPTNPPISTTAPSSAPGTKIWHFCHVMPGAVIGERCNLGQNVVVMPGTRVGQQRQDPEQRLDLRGRDPGGRRLLRAELRVHQRHEPPQPRLPEIRVSADPGAAGRLDRRQRHHRLRRHPGRILPSSAPARWSGATCRPTP